MPKNVTPVYVKRKSDSRDSEVEFLSAILREDLGTFVAKVFQTVSPGDRYFHNWHIDAVVHQLRRVQAGDNRRLIITQPPRSLKSICASVAYVAWHLGQDPSHRFACVSYSAELAATFARQFRTVVSAEWYRALFPNMRLVKDTESEAVTTKGGGRFAVAVGGSFTGRGADTIIIDDPMKADDAHSERIRRTVNDWYGGTLLSRLDDKETGAIILVMQRLHEEDLAGKLLREGDWYHLDLPAISQDDETIPIGGNAVHKRFLGEPLHADREPLSVLEEIRREMGSLPFSAQYLQRPVPFGGNLIQRDWIAWYETKPDRGNREVVQSWDVASTTSVTSDYSVCTTWLMSSDRSYALLDVWRGRREFPFLVRKVRQLAREHSPNRILIEQSGPGLHVIQQLRAEPSDSPSSVIGIRPDAEKVVRMEAQSARFEAGGVSLPRNAPWLGDFLGELLAFPNGRFDDQIDSVSQFLNWAEKHYLYRPRVSLCGPIFCR